MTYGVVTTVAAPVELYDVVHRRVLDQIGSAVDGLLLHLGRARHDGFEVIEVWNSREDCERFNQQVVWPIMAALSPGAGPVDAAPVIEEFEVRGLLVPQGQIAH